MSRSVFTPVLLLTLAVLLFTVFQFQAVWNLSSRLQNQSTSLSETHEQAEKVRAQLNNMATELRLLADSGNNNAKAIVAQLEKRGVRIDIK